MVKEAEKGAEECPKKKLIKKLTKKEKKSVQNREQKLTN
jgi:hypothetical protein